MPIKGGGVHPIAFSIALINMREAITKAKELNKIEHALLLEQELDSWRLYGLKKE
ncbi:MAG: hypothetical protein IIA77_01620 [Proteobacteria bacterium]|nr:hypothetical protein [Pseudomonadota bacterium]